MGVPRQDRTDTVTTTLDSRLWHPWLRINRVLRVMLPHALERGGLGAGSDIRRAGWFIHENASGVKAVLSGWAPAAASVNHPFAHIHA